MWRLEHVSILSLSHQSKVESQNIMTLISYQPLQGEILPSSPKRRSAQASRERYAPHLHGWASGPQNLEGPSPMGWATSNGLDGLGSKDGITYSAYSFVVIFWTVLNSKYHIHSLTMFIWNLETTLHVKGTITWWNLLGFQGTETCNNSPWSWHIPSENLT